MDTIRTEEDSARVEARAHARALRWFYLHATTYAGVMVFLLFVNFASGDVWQGNFWVQGPAMGWGIALVIHGIFAMRGNELFGREWEDRKVEELMRRNQGH
jgi:hypothetical protein